MDIPKLLQGEDPLFLYSAPILILPPAANLSSLCKETSKLPEAEISISNEIFSILKFVPVILNSVG